MDLYFDPVTENIGADWLWVSANEDKNSSNVQLYCFSNTNKGWVEQKYGTILTPARIYKQDKILKSCIDEESQWMKKVDWQIKSRLKIVKYS